jgi:hypothetical protein
MKNHINDQMFNRSLYNQLLDGVGVLDGLRCSVWFYSHLDVIDVEIVDSIKNQVCNGLVAWWI